MIDLTYHYTSRMFNIFENVQYKLVLYRKRYMSGSEKWKIVYMRKKKLNSAYFMDLSLPCELNEF